MWSPILDGSYILVVAKFFGPRPYAHPQLGPQITALAGGGEEGQLTQHDPGGRFLPPVCTPTAGVVGPTCKLLVSNAP
jgi:hypothetical protein